VVRSSDSRYAAAGTDPAWRSFGGAPDQECEYEYEQEYEYGQESEWCGRATLDMRPLGRTPPGPPFLRGGSFAQHTRREITAP
jgi:hypothetical protein